MVDVKEVCGKGHESHLCAKCVHDRRAEGDKYGCCAHPSPACWACGTCSFEARQQGPSIMEVRVSKLEASVAKLWLCDVWDVGARVKALEERMAVAQDNLIDLMKSSPPSPSWDICPMCGEDHDRKSSQSAPQPQQPRECRTCQHYLPEPNDEGTLCDKPDDNSPEGCNSEYSGWQPREGVR